MRFEAKHSYFKQLAQAMGNFINLPYSLAMRHQHLRCYQANNVTGIPGDGLIVGPGMILQLSKLKVHVHYLGWSYALVYAIYAVWCSIITYSIMKFFLVIGSVAIPDGLQEELDFPISCAYK